MTRQPNPSKALLVMLGLMLPPAAAHLSRRLVGTGYKAVSRQDPPRNPASPEVEWKDAITWSIATGVIGGLTRLAVRRAIAEAALRAAHDHDLPEPVEDAAEQLESSMNLLD